MGEKECTAMAAHRVETVFESVSIFSASSSAVRAFSVAFWHLDIIWLAAMMNGIVCGCVCMCVFVCGLPASIQIDYLRQI